MQKKATSGHAPDINLPSKSGKKCKAAKSNSTSKTSVLLFVVGNNLCEQLGCERLANLTQMLMQRGLQDESDLPGQLPFPFWPVHALTSWVPDTCGLSVGFYHPAQLQPPELC